MADKVVEVATSAVGNAAGVTPTADFLPDWLAHPPGWLTWLSLFVAAATFLWKLYEYRVDRIDRQHDHELSVREFWYRSFVVPGCVAATADFLVQKAVKLRAIFAIAGSMEPSARKIEYATFLADYKRENSDLLGKLMLVLVVDRQAYESTKANLESAEDAVTLHCHACCINEGDLVSEVDRQHGDVGSIVVKLSDVRNTVIKEFMALHFRLAPNRRK